MTSGSSSPRSPSTSTPLPISSGGRETPSTQPAIDPHAASPTQSLVVLSSSLPSTVGSPPKSDAPLPSEKERERALYPSRVILTSERACPEHVCTSLLTISPSFSVPGPAWHKALPTHMGCRRSESPWSSHLFAPRPFHQAAQCNRSSLGLLLDLPCTRHSPRHALPNA